MDRLVTTFPRHGEFAKAIGQLDDLGLPYEVVRPPGVFARVAVPAVVVDQRTRIALWQDGGERFTCSGWVAYRPASAPAPPGAPRAFSQDVFGKASIMFVGSCVADQTRLRLTAHLTGDLAGVMPYWNAEMREACYNARGRTLTFMDAHRMITLYPRRIAMAKIDEIADAWRMLEEIRCRANGIWARRGEITPSDEMREKPPALEIFKRLPRTNCGQCGQATCLAFAVRVWTGYAGVSGCRPVFAGDRRDLKDAILQICAGLGLLEDPKEEATT